MVRSLRWRILIWAAALIAAMAAVLLGVVALIAGLATASGLAGVIVGFCELVAAMLAVIGWAGEHRPATAPGQQRANSALPAAGQADPSPGQATGHQPSKYAVNLGDNNQGVVIGDDNVQNIDFHPHRDHE